MTSQLNVDTIVDKAGSGGTNVKIANTSVTVAEGGSGTTNTVQGLAKAWLTMDGTGTIAIVDSFNIAGITDNNTGNHSYTYSNNIATTKHPVTGSVIGSTSSNYFSFAASNGVAQATTGSGVNTKHHSGATDDQNHVHILAHGDLA